MGELPSQSESRAVIARVWDRLAGVDVAANVIHANARECTDRYDRNTERIRCKPSRRTIGQLTIISTFVSRCGMIRLVPEWN